LGLLKAQRAGGKVFGVMKKAIILKNAAMPPPLFHFVILFEPAMSITHRAWPVPLSEGDKLTARQVEFKIGGSNRNAKIDSL
jgi:hypothetical protein